MVVPDFELIAEIMLVAEGFIDARILARKFLTLYTLCKELLSKQDHYDWGLRAIKSVLVVAGSLKRGDRGRPEDQVKKIITANNFHGIKFHLAQLSLYCNFRGTKLLVKVAISAMQFF